MPDHDEGVRVFRGIGFGLLFTAAFAALVVAGCVVALALTRP